MKKLIIILFVLVASLAYGQGITKQFGHGYKNVNGFRFGWLDGSDTLGYFRSVGLQMKKPILLNVWNTAGRPSSPVAGMLGFNSDSATIEWYSSAWNQPGVGGGGGTSYTFSTGLNNSSGTVTANISTGVSGGQTIIGSTSTTSGLTLKSTTGVGTTGADYIFTGGNNGATEFMRILNSGNVGIGTNNPATKLAVIDGNSRFDAWDGSNTYGYVSTLATGGAITLNFTRTLSSGAEKIIFPGGNYIYNHQGDGEVRIFTNSGGNFLTLYGNGFERIRLPTGGGVTFNTSTNSYTFPTSRASAGQILTDVAGDGNLSWATGSGATTIYNGDGAISGNRLVTRGANTLTFTGTGLFEISGNHVLNLGTGGSPLSSLNVTSSGRLALFSGITYGTDADNTDADYTVAANTIIAEVSDILTADRTLTLPTASVNGQTVTLLMRFSTDLDTYSLSAAVTDNATGLTFTQLDWGKTYDFMVDQGLQWRLIRKY